MSTLLLRLEAPLQSWGTVTRGRIRSTYGYPTKSGIVGLIANALGRTYDDDITDLAALRMGVRLDRRGALIGDYSALQYVARSNNGNPKPSHEQWKMYVSDGAFLVGLAGDRGILEGVQAALEAPARLLFLGRKACPPSAPLTFRNGLLEDGLAQSLIAFPWFLNSQKPNSVIAQIEDPAGAEMMADVPLGCFADRRFGTRQVRWITIEVCSQEEEDEQNPVFF